MGRRVQYWVDGFVYSRTHSNVILILIRCIPRCLHVEKPRWVFLLNVRPGSIDLYFITEYGNLVKFSVSSRLETQLGKQMCYSGNWRQSDRDENEIWGLHFSILLNGSVECDLGIIYLVIMQLDTTVRAIARCYL